MKSLGRKPLFTRVIDYLLKGTVIMSTIEELTVALAEAHASVDLANAKADLVVSNVGVLTQKINELLGQINTGLEVPAEVVAAVNDIKAEADGIVSKLVPVDGEVVEPGQP